jgi:RNA polymerase sigma-70 factor (ECF subfamily)
MRSGDTSLGGSQREFPKTLWELVARAHDASAETRREGLEGLCRRYWKPVYYYVRIAWAKSNEDAKDLTQAFFLWLTQGDAVGRYRPERASFRTYLKSLLQHFVHHQEDAMRRLKRGGGIRLLELDGELAALKNVLADPRTPAPEKAFDRAWRNSLVTDAVRRVRERFHSRGREMKFRVYEEHDLCPPDARPSYAQLAGRLGLKERDVDNYLCTVREEVRREIRAELAKLTTDAAALEEEWNAFFGP